MADENKPQRRALSLDPKTIELIERVVHDEAAGEGVEGRNAVRAVIYNRLAANRPDFGGGTVRGVLNKKGQFQGVWQKARGDAARLPLPNEVRDQYVQEHIAFLKGGVDPTNGATFFLNPEIAQRPFNQNQKGLRIGNHVFFDNYNGNKVEVPTFQVALRGFKRDLTQLALTSPVPAPPKIQTTAIPGQAPALKPYKGPVEQFFDKINPFSSAPAEPSGNQQVAAVPPPQSQKADTPKLTPFNGPLTLADNKGINGFAEGGMPKKEEDGYQTLKTVADIATDFVPIVGEVKSGYQAYDAFKQGNYGEAAINAVGAVPLVGGVMRAAKGTTKAAGAVSDVFKPLTKADTSKAAVDAPKVASEVAESKNQFTDLSGKLARAVPEKTVKAYKLFRTNPDKPGELFPLFVNADKGVPTGQWIDAEVGPLTQGGKVKSKIGELAYRPGWHAGDYIAATHIGGKSQPGLTKPDYRPANQVWAEVELPDDVDWQSIANSRASAVKSGPNKGQPNVKEAHITDQVPTGGHYRYKTNSNMQGNWLIGGSMKVNKTLEPEEIATVQKQTGIYDLPSLPELIDQKGLKLKDLNGEALKELKAFYPEKFAAMSENGLFAGGVIHKYPEESEDGVYMDFSEFESEDDMSCGMMKPDIFDLAVGVDPVSGNPIPPGSGPENVRDDIPAVLSDGEYVVPADVVRYHGLKTFMELRAEAKMGLMAMMMEGQIRPIDEEMTDEDPEAEEEESDSEDADESTVSAEEDSAEEGDEELPEGEYETPEGNVVKAAKVDTEVEGMDAEEDESEYGKDDFYGDEEVITIFIKDPKAFKRI